MLQSSAPNICTVSAGKSSPEYTYKSLFSQRFIWHTFIRKFVKSLTSWEVSSGGKPVPNWASSSYESSDDLILLAELCDRHSLISVANRKLYGPTISPLLMMPCLPFCQWHKKLVPDDGYVKAGGPTQFESSRFTFCSLSRFLRERVMHDGADGLYTAADCNTAPEYTGTLVPRLENDNGYRNTGIATRRRINISAWQKIWKRRPIQALSSVSTMFAMLRAVAGRKKSFSLVLGWKVGGVEVSYFWH